MRHGLLPKTGQRWEEGGQLVLAPSMLGHRAWLLLSILDFLAPPSVALISCHLSLVFGRIDLMSGGAGIPHLQPLGQVLWLQLCKTLMSTTKAKREREPEGRVSPETRGSQRKSAWWGRGWRCRKPDDTCPAGGLGGLPGSLSCGLDSMAGPGGSLGRACRPALPGHSGRPCGGGGAAEPQPMASPHH